MPKVIDLDALFQVTVRVFGERGYAATTTQEIAAQAAVSEVTLYRRFGTKAALVATALWHALAKAPLSKVEAGSDVRADLTAIARAYAETNRIYGGAVVTLMTDLPRYPELREAVTALVPNMQRAASVIAHHQRRGALTAGNPLQMAVQLIAPLLAEGLWRRMNVGVTPPPFEPEAVAETFLRGHGTPANDHGAP